MYQAQPRPTDLSKIELQAQVSKLRSAGRSFPAIAKHLVSELEVLGIWLTAKDTILTLG